MEIVKILIVEDDIGFAYLVQHQLTNLGFQSQNILTVHTLEDARLAQLEFEIDVILLDLNLKESQGIETFNEINSIFIQLKIFGFFVKKSSSRGFFIKIRHIVYKVYCGGLVVLLFRPNVCSSVPLQTKRPADPSAIFRSPELVCSYIYIFRYTF